MHLSFDCLDFFLETGQWSAYDDITYEFPWIIISGCHYKNLSGENLKNPVDFFMNVPTKKFYKG